MSESTRPRSASSGNVTYAQAQGFFKSGTKAEVAYAPYSIIRATTSSEMHGTETPHFRARVARGELIPMTPWSQFSSKSELTSGENDLTYMNGSTLCRSRIVSGFGSGDFLGVLPISKSYFDGLIPFGYEYLVTNAAAQIYDQGWDALTFLAELSSLRNMFSSFYQNLVRLIKRRRIPKNWRSLPARWLEYRYGWRPLINDCKAIAGLLAKIGDGKVMRRKAASSTSLNDDVTTILGPSQLSTVGTYSVTIQNRVSIGVKGSVVADASVPAMQFNPLQTGWELIPFSFVVDWVLNVGKTISAIALLNCSVAHTAALGYSINVRRTIRYFQSSYNANYRSGLFTCEGTAEANLTVRSPCSVPHIPRFNLRLSQVRLIDLVALIAQRIKEV